MDKKERVYRIYTDSEHYTEKKMGFNTISEIRGIIKNGFTTESADTICFFPPHRIYRIDMPKD